MALKRKRCFVCKKKKSLSAFYAHPEMADGCLNKCKECCQAYQNQRREDPAFRTADNERRSKHYYENKERHLQKVKKYGQTEKGKKARRAASDRWNAKNPAAKKAIVTLNNAVRDGRILKPKRCSVCGKKKALHGHHDNYSKPLAVEWLCAGCHSALHSKAKKR